ncbi:DUF3800 domain-containing protein [Neobacillus rhizophilus]|uniref:DUF3800 domain-containing protein n=1 Tax=Neobacillus rhizophilus TaxID=2833579 RepID=A0A942TZE1_9BACI|nr:DUF3800 domain-containing protein [Neobacillus rhizophilus]MBS4211615.1 hypothetical protein [Neobacillus rhizophilus]
MNESYTFYYDETNNIRSFHLKEGNLNAMAEANFVLGGVMHIGNNPTADFNTLRSDLKLQKTVKEIKLRHLATGNFIECLNSKKLNIYLNWLLTSDLYIHYTNLNIFYYSIVDIIDSIIDDAILRQFPVDLINNLKNDLYRIAMLEKDSFIDLFYTFEYPNIKDNKITDFIDSLIDIIDKYISNIDFHIGLTIIKQLLKQSRKKGELYFLNNETDHSLINDFSDFFLRSIYLFKNSHHVFDEESVIEGILNDIDLYDGGKKVKPYEFVGSKKTSLTQVSDVIVGLLGKCFLFINSTPAYSLHVIKKGLKPLQLDNLTLLINIIAKSNNFNKALLLSVTSLHEREKTSILLSK